MAINYRDDYRYANQRLNQSYVRKGSTIVNVREVMPNGTVLYVTLSGRMSECHLEDLDLEPFPMGFVNDTNEAVYVSRIPRRCFRQGVQDSTIRTSTGRRMRINHNFVNTMLGIYPNIDFCIESVIEDDDCKSKAFSRIFAVSDFGKGYRHTRRNTLRLLYKSRPAGEINVVKKSLKLDNNLSFLREYLKEVMDKSGEGVQYE